MARAAPFLRLTRFPLVFTAMADSAAGYLLTLPANARPDAVVLALLAATSACLYACGMVFNDVADVWRDRVLHRERPLPSGRVTVHAARRFGLVLMFAAALFGCLVNFMTGQGVLLIFILVMAYDFYAKARAVPGSVAMGAIRAANVILGVLAVAPPAMGLVVLPPWDRAGYAQALVLGGYVFFLTLMSTLEEKRASKGLFVLCGIAMAAAPVGALALKRATPGIIAAAGLSALLLAHALASLRSLDRAAIMRNVKWGVLAIIPLDASFVLSTGRWKDGLAVLALALPALVLMPLFRRL